MISLEEWNAMGVCERSIWCEINCNISGAGRKKGLIFGVGVNDANYCTQPTINGAVVRDPAYAAWANMIKRCYSHKFQLSQPTYSGFKVCREWHSFMAFRAWWIEHQVDGWHLDKDLLSDAMEYSPDSCIFVPCWLNTFTNDCGASRGTWPKGVCFDKSIYRFKARRCNPISGKYEHIGVFSNHVAAYIAWLDRKLDLALELKPKMDEIDSRIYPRIVEIIRSAK